MRIENVVCSQRTEIKLEKKHSVTVREARQIFFSRPRIRFVEKGYTTGEDVYVAFGQTLGGRYLSIFFLYKPARKTALVIGARDMTDKERKAYGRK